MLNKEINMLLNYSVKNNFISKDERDNFITSVFNKEHQLISENTNDYKDDYLSVWDAIENKMNFKNTLDLDIFTDELSSHLIGGPEFIQSKFDKFDNVKDSFDWYQDLSKFTTYIKVNRIKRNKLFKNNNVIVTFNKSKPEKTPEQIKEALNNPSKISILSQKQVGLKGSVSQNPRMAHRIITLPFNKDWFIQYSPYQYFNKHSIIIDKNQNKMKVDNKALSIMLDFLEYNKTFNISLNADLPIVGGSILNHMHFQSGQFNFPIYKSQKTKIKEGMYLLDWKIATILLENKNKNILLTQANKIIELWKQYSNTSYKNIFNSKHNTVSLTAKKEKENFQIYIILRNNATDYKNPSGIFHVAKEYQYIKNENIGIVEACGVGILPGRLDYELIKNSKDKGFINWKKFVGGFETKKEYRKKILYTFEEILKGCNPFKISGVKEDFTKEIKNV